jgi:excisionase family DNA binding protein
VTTAAIPQNRNREARTYLPEQARELFEFAHAINGIDVSARQSGQAMLVGPDGVQHIIPSELFEVLEVAARHLALGDGVTIMPNAAKLTTQEVADFLGMSRPTLVKLLEAGEMPFETVGRHRRVTLRDVVAYQERARSERRATLGELARDGIAESQPTGVPNLKRIAEMES